MTKQEQLRKFRNNGYLNIPEYDAMRDADMLSPKTSRTFGVEIECIAPSREAARDFQIDVNNSGVCYIREESYNHVDHDEKSRMWKIVTDASVRPTNGRGYPMEIVSPVLKEANGFKQLKTICTLMKKYNFTANRSCGLHVHLGAGKNFRVQHCRRLLRFYRDNALFIDSMMPKSRIGNQYCSALSITDRRIDNAQTIRELSYAIGTRYSVINLEAYIRHGTIEFRQHSGTVEYEKIANWVNICQSMMRMAWMTNLPTEERSDTHAFCATLEMSKELSDYYLSRVNHFHHSLVTIA